MKISIKNIKIKNRIIHIGLDGIDAGTQVILKDETSGRVLKGTRTEDAVEFAVKTAGSALGNFSVMAFIDDKYELVEVPEAMFKEIRLSDYFYDQEKDIYIRYNKNEEGKLNIVIGRGRDIPGKQKIQIKGAASGKGFIELLLDGELLREVDEYRYLVVPASLQGMWCLPANYDMDTEVFRVDMQPFINDVKQQDVMKKKWRMYVETIKDGEYKIYALGADVLENRGKDNKTDYFDCREDYLAEIHSYEYEGEKLSICPYLTQKNNLALMLLGESTKFSVMVMNRIREIQLDKNGVTLQMDIHHLEGYDLTNVEFKFRTKKHDEEEILLCPITVKERKGSTLLAEAYIDFKKVKIRPLIWDVSVVYEKDGMQYMTHLANDSKLFDKKYFKSLFAKKTVNMDNGEIFYPYRTLAGYLAFQCRSKGEYDNLAFRLKERLAAFIYFILKPYWINKNIYLVYEKFCVMAQDNGYYFFKYCMENGVEEQLNRRIYYVMDPKSPDWEKVSQYKDRVIPFMSLKHMVYLIASKLLISTDTIDHVYAWRPKDSILHQYLDSKKLVFLQHGVIALKKVHFLYSSDKRGRCNIFITSNNMERDIIYDYFGYRMDQIAVTGLCRWDVLEDKSEGLREVLIMPTWRNWLDEVSDEMFKESDYYHNYMAFLNSNWLKEYLEKYDLRLNFYLHPKFREYISNFKIEGERLRLIAFGEEPLNELMMRCKLLVTDYSSVCWDVFYQGKPVIFYQFDADQYEEAHGSYIDFEKDLFGDRAVKPEELMNLLDEYAGNEFALKEQYAKMHKDCYKYIDKDNSKRICEEIVKRGW